MTQDILKTDYLGGISIKLNPGYLMEKAILDEGIWEKHVVASLYLLLSPGSVCVDVGANTGILTLAMAQLVGENGCIHAFEPSNTCFPRLTDNVGLNPSLSNVVKCYKKGVSNKAGSLKLFRSGDGSNAYMAEEYNPDLWNRGTADDFELCEVVNIDEFLAGQAIDLLKIDVEGMEIDVLRGAANTLKQYAPSIIFETLISDFDHDRIKQSEEFLRATGYLIFAYDIPTGKLMPVTFPCLHEDSIAIHSSKLAECRKFIKKFAIYHIETSSEMISFEDIEITLTEEKIFLRFSQAGEISSLAAPVSVNKNPLVIKAEEPSGMFSCSLEFQDLSRKGFSGTFSLKGVSISIKGQSIYENLA